ncbi:hypothetical protein BT96DRAFT_1022342 [Gymnopus androsaceus JB14]|uniref:Uncharacterized protein n=1 Tax=Gymnopus androsaceus JB14 TaxID=1447944 RepID=A0A6A4HAG9_9AGAR|nr:hypothetical protein BT96DRAFT_1022342 [Gymnopus androsaceus JB14]
MGFKNFRSPSDFNIPWHGKDCVSRITDLTMLALALFVAASAVLATPHYGRQEAEIQCAPAVNGTLQLVMPDNEDITRTGASFTGPDYAVAGVEAKLLKIFAPENAEFYFNACNSTFMGWEQSYSEFGITFLYGQLQDVTTGLCVTASQLGDYVTTYFYAADCSTLDDVSQLYQFFRIEIQPTSVTGARDPEPTISFIGLPQSDDTDGAERYTYSYDRATLATGDAMPDVVGTNPRSDNSDLGFFAPEYYF